MSSWTWAHPEMVHLYWVVAAFVGLLAYRELATRSELSRFVSKSMQRRLATTLSAERRVLRLFMMAAALSAGVMALMQPQTKEGVSQERATRVVADVVVAMDVSKSMLAEDAAPNRLARSKAEVSRMLDELAGHRVALVAFAGKAALLSPLTSDYGFFRMMLRGASPTSVSRGGTAIGEAIRQGLEAFDKDGGAASRLLLLITDGEDHGSYPEEAAKAAKEAGVRIVAIGLGSEEGTQIRITNPRTGVQELVRDRDGNPVITRVDGELLEKIATLSDGAYIPAKVNALDLQSIVDEHIEPLVEEAAVQASRIVPDERYPIFILLSMTFLFFAVLAGVGPLRRSSDHA